MARKYEEQDVLITVEVLNNVGDKLASEIDNITQTELPAIESDIEDINHQIDEGVSAPLIIVIRGSESYEGKGVTAKSKIDGREYHSTITDGVTYIKVKSPGEYIITNEYDDSSLSAVVGDPLDEEVYFTDYYGSINVTVPDILIGETIRAEYQGHTVEKLIESKIEILSVNFKGQWEVGIKDNTYIQKQTVDMQEIGDSKTCNLSVGEGVPYITVTLADELVGETIVCKKEESQKSKLGKTNTVQFLVNQLGHYTICLERSELLSKTAEVNSTEEVKVTLDLNDLTVPVLIVRSKEEDNGKTIKVTKGEKSYQRELKDRFALFILEETGQWIITCEDYPKEVKNVEAIENQVYEIFYRAKIIGIRVNQEEADPEMRVEVIEDTELNGVTPFSLDRSRPSFNDMFSYGDMPNTFLYQSMDNPCLLSLDGSEEIMLDPNDYSKKLDGTPAPSATINDNYNVMNKIEKLYHYMYEKDGYEYYYISDVKVNDNYDAIGFIREDGSEADCIYISCYLATLDSQGRARSISGTYFRNQIKSADMYNSIQKCGDGYSLLQWQHVNHLRITFLMLWKNFVPIKPGGHFWRTPPSNNVYTDHTPQQKMKTGFGDKRGAVWGNYVDNQLIDSGGIKFMHMEDLWGGGYCVSEGFLIDKCQIYVKMKPPYAKNVQEAESTYTKTDFNSDNSVQGLICIKKSKCSNEFGRIPYEEDSGDSTKYEGGVIQTGALTVADNNAGFFRMGMFYTDGTGLEFTERSDYVFRLIYTPPKKD